MSDIPEGFTRLERGGPFLSSLGALYGKHSEGGLVIGMRIEAKHLNTRGIAHGGMLVSLADSALGISIATSQKQGAAGKPRSFVTVNLTVDFLASAHEGDFVEAHVDIEKVGARLAFATCSLQTQKRKVLRASGVFATVAPAKPKERFEG